MSSFRADTSHEILLFDIEDNRNELSPSESRIDNDLARINAELDRHTNRASMEDYALAVASGILAGIVDSLYIGETHLFGEETNEARGRINERVNRFIQKYASARGIESEHLKGSIIGLEDRFKVAQDNVWKGADIMVSAKNHHLADIAHHPTPLGLASAIAVQFLRFGTFANREGEWNLIAVETTQEDILRALIPAIMTGFLNWIVSISEDVYEDQAGEEVPEAIRKLAKAAASAPMLAEVARCADNWFGHLVSDMGGSRNTPGGGMGVPGVFLSLAYELSMLPGLRDTGLPAYLDQLYTKQKLDLRHELVAVEALGRQAVPVLLNEAVVRMGFFVSRLARAFSARTPLKEVRWAEAIPVGNRTVDRMMTVASMTFTLADTADAAVHASLESAGNWVLFSQRFVVRYNYMAAGRAAVAVVREFSDDAREAQLIRERRLLVEARAALTIERLEQYKAQLSERVDEFIAEDLQAFLEGINMMDEGLRLGNSDLVIAGNVVIQRVLGREPQFASQAEFDVLMESDDDFVF